MFEESGRTYYLPTAQEEYQYCQVERRVTDRHILKGPVLINHYIYGMIVAVGYDFNGDAIIDYIIYWNPSTKWARWYWIDLDFDKNVDVVYVDHTMNGECDHIPVEWRASFVGDKPYSYNRVKGET